MNKKKTILIFSLVVGAGALAAVAMFKNKSDNLNTINSFAPRVSHTLKEMIDSVQWGTGRKGIVNQTISDEFTFQEVQKDILVPLQMTLMNGGKLDIQNLFVKTGGTVFGIDTRPVNLIDDRDGIKRYSWSNLDEKASSSAKLVEYTKIFSRIEDFRIDIKSYYVDMQERRESDASPERMKLSGYLELRGHPLEGGLRHDLGRVELMVNHFEGKWKIEQLRLNNVSSIVSMRAPGFTEITKNAFNEEGPGVYLRREAIRRGGYAVSLSDINQDGFLDMYVGSQQESQMWMFNPVAAKFENKMQNVLANEKMVKTAIFNDFDNDQDEDLFVTTFNPVEDKNGLTEDLVIYRNDNGVLTKVGDPSRGMKKLSAYYPMPAVVGDFNNDGLSDVYVGFPGKKDFTFTNLVGHEVVGGNKSVQGLFINKGSLAFNESELFFPDMKTGERQYLYPHSALAVDWNKDHNMDIVVIDDQDNLSPFYKNKGNAVFEQVAEKIGITNRSNAMSMAVGDYNNDGLLDFALSSVNIYAASRFEHALINLWHRDEVTNETELAGNGVRLFQQAKDGQFTEMTNVSGLDYVGEGTAGLEFIDYNGDGYLDLYITNGLWSGNDRFQDAGHLLVNHKFLENRPNLIKDRLESTISSFMSFLIDFRGDLFDQKYVGNKSMSVGGYQRNRLYRNNGDGTFVDMGFVEGVDSINDGYVVAAGDLNKDGKTDLVLRNGDPAQKEHLFPAVQIFQNNMDSGNTIDLALKNNKGRDAIGVGVTIEYEGFKQYKQLISNNGAAQSERSLNFGIGKRDSIAKLTVHWPSGNKVYNGVKAGKHVFSEISSALSQK